MAVMNAIHTIKRNDSEAQYLRRTEFLKVWGQRGLFGENKAGLGYTAPISEERKWKHQSVLWLDTG